MENERTYSADELLDPDVDVGNNGLTRPSWMYPKNYWKAFGPILSKSSSYSDFRMRCELAGYFGYFTRWHKEQNLMVYDSFVLSEACRIVDRVNSFKLQMFRDQLNSIRMKNQ